MMMMGGGVSQFSFCTFLSHSTFCLLCLQIKNWRMFFQDAKIKRHDDGTGREQHWHGNEVNYILFSLSHSLSVFECRRKISLSKSHFEAIARCVPLELCQKIEKPTKLEPPAIRYKSKSGACRHLIIFQTCLPSNHRLAQKTWFICRKIK